MLQEGRGAVQMKAAYSASSDGQVLQDLGLQRSAEPLGLPDPVVLGGGLELGERGDAQDPCRAAAPCPDGARARSRSPARRQEFPSGVSQGSDACHSGEAW